MIFIAGASMLKSTILLTDAMLVGVSDYSYRRRGVRMDMFNTNRENVSSFYCYIRSIDPDQQGTYNISDYCTQHYLNNVCARMLVLPGADKNDLNCLCMDNLNRRYGVPNEVKARGWRNYWWEL